MHDAIATIFRQSEPAEFDDAGMRVWQSREEVIRKLGGNGVPLHRRLSSGGGSPWLVPPKVHPLLHQFRNAASRLFDSVSLHAPPRICRRHGSAPVRDTQPDAAIRVLLDALGLGERYEFWLKELVRINESEAARAGRQPLPLWDFSAPNTITREPIPAIGDLTPMRWYWELFALPQGDRRSYSRPHLRLPRTLAPLPDDFGVALTGQNIDAHLARSRAQDHRVGSSESRAWHAQIAAARREESETALQPSSRGHLLVGPHFSIRMMPQARAAQSC